MKVLIIPAAGFLVATLALGSTASAQTLERLTDKDVKTLIDAVDQGRDRFEDRLEGRLKDSILRGPTGEVNVARFLDDFQENLDRLADRFKPAYAASIEAATVLRQATAIHTFMKQQPPDLKGASEWDHLVGNLSRLAAAYGTRFPLEKDAVVRRISDGEAAAAAAEIEGQAEQLEDAVNRETTLAKPAKEGLKDIADLVGNSAKTLKSRLKESKPATAEARQLFDAIQRIDESSKGLDLSPASLTLVGSLKAPLATLRQAFGVATVSGT